MFPDGRFRLLLGVTTSAMCLGATVLAISVKLWHKTICSAVLWLGFMSLIPFIQCDLSCPSCLCASQETAAATTRELMLTVLNEQRRRILASRTIRFDRRTPDLSVAIPELSMAAQFDI
jgi:hypothetical protein